MTVPKWTRNNCASDQEENVLALERQEGEVLMSRRELLNQLIKKYSFEKSHAIIQLAIEDGTYENNEVQVVVAETHDGTLLFSINWK